MTDVTDTNQPVGPVDDPLDIELHSYQDDLDTHGADRFADSSGDDPTEALGVPAARFKEELARLDTDSPSDDVRGEEDDMREEVESMDMDPDRDERA